MTKQQLFAVQFFMSGYPASVTDFDEMLKVIAAADDTARDDLENEDDMPLVWQPFDIYSSAEVARRISHMADDLTAIFDAKEQ